MLQEGKGVQEMSLAETIKARDHLLNRTQDMNKLKKRFETVNKSR